MTVRRSNNFHTLLELSWKDNLMVCPTIETHSGTGYPTRPSGGYSVSPTGGGPGCIGLTGNSMSKIVRDKRLILDTVFPWWYPTIKSDLKIWVLEGLSGFSICGKLSVNNRRITRNHLKLTYRVPKLYESNSL